MRRRLTQRGERFRALQASRLERLLHGLLDLAEFEPKALLLDLARLREADDPRERDVQPEGEGLARHLRVPREAVEHPGDRTAPAGLAQEHRLVLGVHAARAPQPIGSQVRITFPSTAGATLSRYDEQAGRLLEDGLVALKATVGKRAIECLIKVGALDRYGSRGLSLFYAIFQILVACVFLGFGNVTAYKIASSLVVKPEATWTAADRRCTARSICARVAALRTQLPSR